MTPPSLELATEPGLRAHIGKSHPFPARPALWRRAVLGWLMALGIAAAPAASWAQETRQGRLVTAEWLQAHKAEVLVLDASFTPLHAAGHIEGAVSADLYSHGAQEPTPAQMQQRMQRWGIGAGRKLVLYDQGADMMATRLFFDLYYHGVPLKDLHILDGGLARWRASGGAVTQQATPAPPQGDIQVQALREEVRVRLPEFLGASGDPQNHVLVEGLGLDYHFGAQQFFGRAGHVPGAVAMPFSDFFNADKTFKSAAELQRMLRYHRIGPQQVLHTHCGGGVAASVPWFALRFLADHPRVTLYLESQQEWLRDDRDLPFFTYSAPQLLRSSAWVNGWNSPMQRAIGVSRLNLVDLREPAAFAGGHVPFSINLPASSVAEALQNPGDLARRLGQAGVHPQHELVLVSERGLTPATALAYVALHQAGHPKLSLLTDSVDEWGLLGLGLQKSQPPTANEASSPRVRALPDSAQQRAGVSVSDALSTRGEYPKVYIDASDGSAQGAGAALTSAQLPAGAQVLQLPYRSLLRANGLPKPAKELWALFEQAGVPRYAELMLFAAQPGEAAVNYFIFKLMGWPDVKLWLR